MPKKMICTLVLLLLLGLTSLSAHAQSAQPVTITWFVGLGTGGTAEQRVVQDALVQRLNAAQNQVRLEVIYAEFTQANAALRQLIAQGNPPDIVGPVGVGGSNSFSGQWLDLQPLVERFGYDLSQFPAGTVDFYRLPDQGLVALPFGVSPSALYFNRDLFDAARVPYPPQAWGAPYDDGDAWTFDKLAEVAMRLTLDASGNNALSSAFDPAAVVQWGFMPQWTDARGEAAFFGAGSFVNANGVARIPDPWWDAFDWYYDGIWTRHFIPGDLAFEQDGDLGENPFASGRVAMIPGHLWYAASTGDINWDFAALPSHNGVITAKLHADSFRILASTDHPDYAFAVLRYLIDDSASELLQVYGMMPARIADMNSYFVRINETYPQGVNWQVIVEALNYVDNPSSESNMPNFDAAQARLAQFRARYRTTPGLNMTAELERLRVDLDGLFQQQPTPTPAAS
jgi:multiple sugar transport system substrate-binding protein